jgi:hypothetical protein
MTIKLEGVTFDVGAYQRSTHTKIWVTADGTICFKQDDGDFGYNVTSFGKDEWDELVTIVGEIRLRQQSIPDFGLKGEDE